MSKRIRKRYLSEAAPVDNTRVVIPKYSIQPNIPLVKANPQVMRDVPYNDPSMFGVNSQVMRRTSAPTHNLDGNPQVMRELPWTDEELSRFFDYVIPASIGPKRIHRNRKRNGGGRKPMYTNPAVSTYVAPTSIPNTPIQVNPLIQAPYSFNGLGGASGYGGATTSWGDNNAVVVKPTPRMDIPIVSVQTESFNDAFARARRQGLKQFEFNGRIYTTNLGGGRKAQEAGKRRTRIGGINVHGMIPE